MKTYPDTAKLNLLRESYTGLGDVGQLEVLSQRYAGLGIVQKSTSFSYSKRKGSSYCGMPKALKNWTFAIVSTTKLLRVGRQADGRFVSRSTIYCDINCQSQC